MKGHEKIDRFLILKGDFSFQNSGIKVLRIDLVFTHEKLVL